MSDRTFTATEIRAAIENYKIQAATVEQQLAEVEKHKAQLEFQQNMLQGAILAFESLFSLPVDETAAPTVNES